MNFLKNLPGLARHETKINYATGNFFIAVNDYTQRDILKNFVFSREYNSLSAKCKFNIEGRPKKISLKTLREIFLTYEGENLISIKDEIGRTTRYEYEENFPVPALEKTPCGYKFSYRYDKVFRLLAVKTEVSEFSFSYNPLNEVVEEKNIFAEVERPEKNFAKFDFEIYDIGGKLIEAREKICEQGKPTRIKNFLIC